MEPGRFIFGMRIADDSCENGFKAFLVFALLDETYEDIVEAYKFHKEFPSNKWTHHPDMLDKIKERCKHNHDEWYKSHPEHKRKNRRVLGDE